MGMGTGMGFSADDIYGVPVSPSTVDGVENDGICNRCIKYII